MSARIPAIARLGIPVLVMLLAGMLALQLLPAVDPPSIGRALPSTHPWWYLGRAAGFVTFGLLLTSVLLGLGISSRVFDGLLVRSWVFDMHQFISIFALLAMLFHALILLPDPYTHFNVVELMMPFASPYRPVAVGLGAIVLYGSAIITLSYYARGCIGQRGWRLLHYLSFAMFAMALMHGVFAGSDSHEGWAQVIYLAGGLLVLFFTFFRILAARTPARPQPTESRQLPARARGG